MLREARTKFGHVRGVAGNDPRVTVYKGIPYAMPPVGDLRWRAPVYGRTWEGILDAVRFSPISIQDQPGIGDNVYIKEWHVDKDVPMDEDCLYLNIWTPANKTDEKLPVLIWYFGGAFQWGYPNEMEFNGERLARRGIIVVSVNYRLGAIGFMAHKDLTAESPSAPTNFGLLDQQAGLKWVYENIEAFGGDPENITIAGQSAGGGSVLNQICNKDNAHMVKGAVIFSGMIRFDGDAILTPAALDKAEKRGDDFLKFMGVSSIEEARKLDALFIRDKYDKFARDHPRLAPCLDGVNYKDDAYHMFIRGDYADIPVLTGYTSDEFNIEGVNRVKSSVEEAVSKLMKSGDKRKVYVYEFCPPIPGPDDPGVFHSVDLWFWFETLGMCWRPFSGKHFELAKKMSNAFASFVKYHDPACPDPSDKENVPQEMIPWNAANEQDLNSVTLTL
ncbi:MAG: carboxylesterase family protein [Lachnospiraceae bacterium]|nr:carboxylesterase family protein [Lachnospiraceae bacterium]